MRYIIFCIVFFISCAVSAQEVPDARKGKEKREDTQHKVENKKKEPKVEKQDEQKLRPLRAPEPPKRVRPERPERSERSELDDMPPPRRDEQVYRNSYGYGRRSTPPSKSRLVYHSGIGYKYYRGVYYKPYEKDVYVVSRPPVGVIVAAAMLEELARVVMPVDVKASHDKYFYYDGTFYVMDRTHNYCVVIPPVGVLVDMLPSGCRRVLVDGKMSFLAEGIHYQPIQHEGKKMYRVVAVPK